MTPSLAMLIPVTVINENGVNITDVIRNINPARIEWTEPSETVGATKIVYIRHDGSTTELFVSEAESAIKAAIANLQAGTADTLTDPTAGVVSVVTDTTLVVTTQASSATLPDGAEGQEKMIRLKTMAASSPFTLTITNAQGPSTYLFNAAGDFAKFKFTDGKWHVIVASNGIVDTKTGAGAISLLTKNTLLVTTAADALTLAAGYEGQRKVIRMKTDGGDGTLTVTNLQGGTTLTFGEVGDLVELLYLDAKWNIIANVGVVLA